GFTEFLRIPTDIAVLAGLQSSLRPTTATVTRENGAREHYATCLGNAHLEGETQEGVILIEPSVGQDIECLLGMDFLSKFRCKLIVDPVSRTVELIRVP